ncbi:MAG: MATE family efflux transporter, partial [Bacteroidales bacterium]|nr:MATE family efflux transporter [Bacteroidales bacterium]
MHRQILRLAVPNIICNITVPLLGAVDLAMMGRLDGLVFAGAVSLGAMIFNFMYWAMGFLRMGTAGFTAQAYGAGDTAEQGRILGRGLVLAFSGALLLWLLQDAVLAGAHWYMDPEAALWTATTAYFKIRIWGAPAAIAAFAFGGWFIGMQNTRIPMWIAVAVNVFNILFNYFFVFTLNLKAEGVAYGTVAAQYLGLGLNLFCLRRFYPAALRHLRDRALWQKTAFGRFLNVNKDVFLRTLLIIAVFSFFTAESARYGNPTLVMNTILYEFFIFFSYAVDGFAHAAEALVGRFTGEG